jgi:hypothetical protein
MAASEMKNTLDATVRILRNHTGDLDFLQLVRLVIAETRADEATAKASILKLNFEGRIGIDLDWSVHLFPVESTTVETEMVSQFVAA